MSCQSSHIPYPSTKTNYLPNNYGSYHQMYRLDGQLIAMGVIDILPNCVSSVYLMYDPCWQKHSLGKVCLSFSMVVWWGSTTDFSSVLFMKYSSHRKYMQLVSLVWLHYTWVNVNCAVLKVPHQLVAGYYIHSCQKMRYKGDYSPSYLLDPVMSSFSFPQFTLTCFLNRRFMNGFHWSSVYHCWRNTSLCAFLSQNIHWKTLLMKQKVILFDLRPGHMFTVCSNRPRNGRCAHS